MANQESRLAIVIDTSRADKPLKSLSAQLKKFEQDSLKAVKGVKSLGENSALAKLSKSINSTKTAMDKLFGATSQANRNIAKLKGSTSSLASTVKTASKGMGNLALESDKANAKMRKLDKASLDLKSSIGGLKGIIGGVFAGIGVSSIFKTADAMQNLDSQVRLVTKSTAEFNAVQSQLRSIANAQYSDIASLTELYTRSRRALEQLGKSQQQTLDFTNNIAMAMRVGGAGAQEQAAALLQLSQALASGVLRGEEFNSIAEQSPILLRLIADEMGVAQGALRKLAADGYITSEVVYNAIAGATEELENMASKMPVTIGQALMVLKNNYQTFVGDFLNSTTGLTGIIASGIATVANNFNSLITILMGAATAWGVYAAANSAFVTTTLPALITGIQTSIVGIISQTTAMQASIASTLSLASMQGFLATTTYKLQQARVVATLALINYKLALLESLAVMRAKTASVIGAIAAQAQYALSIATSGNLLSIFGLAVTGAASSLIAKVTATAAAIRTNVAYASSLVATHGVLGATAIGVTNLTRAIVAKTIAMANAVRQTSAYSLALGALGGATKVAGGAFLGLRNVVVKLASVIKAHPILFIAGTLFTVIAATDGLSAAMESLSDAIAVVGIMFADFVKGAVGWLQGLATVFDKWISGFIQGSADGVNESSSAFGWMFNTTEKGFLGLLQVVANVFDMAAKVIGTFVITVGKGIYNLGISIKNNAATMANALIDGFNWAGRAISNVLNSISRNANKVINLLNKIPNVNIPTWKQDIDLTIQKRFSASQKLDNSWGGNFDSVSRVVDLHGSRAHLDKAIYKHTYNKLRSENTSSEGLDLANAINGVGNALDDAGKKGKKAGDKTKKAAKGAKKELTEEQKAALKLAKAFSDASSRLQKSLAMVGIGTEFEKWKYDLADANNELSKLDKTQKSLLLSLASSLDAKQLIYNMLEGTREIDNQMQLLQAQDDLQRELLSIQQEANKTLSQFNALKEAGMADDYNRIKQAIEINQHAKEDLALATARASINKEISDSVDDINRQIALLGNDNPLSAFLYDLNKTDKYANASEEAITKLEAAIRRLESVKRGDAMSAMVAGLYEQSPLEKLQAEQDERLRIIQESMIAEGGMKQAHKDALLAIDKKYQEDLRRLETAQYQERAGAFAGLAKALMGEHSKLYHALFWIEKGYALQKAWLDSKKAVLDAYANTPGGTIAKMIGAAKAAADTGLMTAAITAINPKGFKQGGYTGNIPTNAIAGAVHGQEYVFDAQATKRIGVNNLERIRRGKDSSKEPKVIINNYSGEKAEVNRMSDGDIIVTIGKISGDIADAKIAKFERRIQRQGGIIHKLSRA